MSSDELLNLEEDLESMPEKQKGNRKWRRANFKKVKNQEIDWPEFMKGLTNKERMILKRVGRGGFESSRRRIRNNRSK